MKVHFKDDSILKIIREYTKEAGVRNLERELAHICRKIAKDIVLADKKSRNRGITVDRKRIENYLGVPRFRDQKFTSGSKVGSVFGLAWTSVGGEILKIDVSVMEGNEKLLLTGQLGDVMKESAQAALSYIRSNSEKLKLKKEFFKNKEIHIHIPEGSIPKDGPSAGITMTIAMISALSSLPASSQIAMTGEITLRGEVLPIGGLNEKLLAAKRYGIKTVLIPKGNEVDLREIQEKVKSDITIIPVDSVEQVIKLVFKNDK